MAEGAGPGSWPAAGRSPPAQQARELWVAVGATAATKGWCRSAPQVLPSRVRAIRGPAKLAKARMWSRTEHSNQQIQRRADAHSVVPDACGAWCPLIARRRLNLKPSSNLTGQAFRLTNGRTVIQQLI